MTTTTVAPRRTLGATGTLMLGTGMAQLLSLMALPVLTRLYSPSAIGAFALFAAVAMLIGLVICGRYEAAIPLPADDRDAASVTRLAVSLGLGGATIALTLGAALWFAGPRLDVPSWWLAVPISLALTSLYQPGVYWFTRKRNYRAIAVSRVFQSLCAATVAIAWGAFVSPNPSALICGALLGQVGATATLAYFSRRTPFPSTSIGSIYHAAQRYRDFPRFTTGSSLLGLATDQLPLVAASWLFGLTVAGELSLSTRLLQAAVVFLAATSAQSYLPRAAEAARSGHLSSISLDLHRKILRWSVVPALGFSAIAPELLALGFGETWRSSGRFLQVQLFWFLTTLGSTGLGHAFAVQEKQKQALVWHATGVTALVVTLAAIGSSGLPLLTIGASMTLVGLVRLLAADWIVAKAGASPGTVVRQFATEVARGVGLLFISLVVANWTSATVAVTIVSGVVIAHVAMSLRAELRGTER